MLSPGLEPRGAAMRDLDAEIKEIAERITRLVRDAYRRGETDAIERLVRLARSDRGQADAYQPEPTLGVAISGKVRKRAPKGAVRELVARSLSDGEGKTPEEIRQQAELDHERMIAQSSIRAHLGTSLADHRRNRTAHESNG
jgi:hypothetical protein